ncbi:glycoside hydrolase family protein [Bacteroides xylanisolvens]|uniref:glycoside hydrolase family protein n=1 Tax=Bacteroides xylanisolvens TaxID=371601 RepID=UPI001C376C47|nr:glycoside hydrolase family protein [Bacteroides xylanisolvens]MBV3830445.1 glycoside hydrolase family protein [Bacteroides xylanisolvens]MBV3873912.1 glycoside hydrolase family protein [Bacteroides xylanisolvens]MBV3878770.1 glycoside hydrolase family protein [Bacteroides xylanisolvens]MBV3905087.1 glycoside hydrolase family protein [Bacteroides xylanisolvens]MBV3910818.1 glycoside hydrolase family protein [Bacteroides xylanisolvens]
MRKQHLYVLLCFTVLGSTVFAQKIENLTKLKRQSENELFHHLGQAPRTPAFESEGYWVWGSSVIKGNDGKYHMFVSRFPKSLPFHPGWMVASEIVHAISDTPEGPYKFSDIALPARGAQYWDGRSTHNPRILEYQNKYYLIYMGSTHPFANPTYDQLTLDSPWCTVGRSNKRIGLAIADSPYGPWKRFDEPILKTKPNTFYSFLVSNSSPIIQEDGSVMMIFKGRAYVGDDKFSDMALGMAYAPSIEGPYTVLNNGQPIFQVDGQGEAEDPFLWKDSRGYHAIFKDHVAKFTGEKGGGVMAHSPNGIQWTIDKDPKAYSRTVEWEDGKVEMQGQLERPFLLFENGKATHAFFATMNGAGGFDNATQSWNMVIPIK